MSARLRVRVPRCTCQVRASRVIPTPPHDTPAYVDPCTRTGSWGGLGMPPPAESTRRTGVYLCAGRMGWAGDAELGHGRVGGKGQRGRHHLPPRVPEGRRRVHRGAITRRLRHRSNEPRESARSGLREGLQPRRQRKEREPDQGARGAVRYAPPGVGSVHAQGVGGKQHGSRAVRRCPARSEDGAETHPRRRGVAQQQATVEQQRDARQEAERLARRRRWSC